MKHELPLASAGQSKNASLRDSIIQLLVEKLSEESRINRILEKVKVRYSHLSAFEYEKALEPLLCLDPVSLYRLLRDSNDDKDRLTDESGLSHFKSAMHSLLTQAIASEACHDILNPNQVREYDSLAFGRLAGAKRRLKLDESLLESLEKEYLNHDVTLDSTNQKKALLPSHLNRSIDLAIAYLMGNVAYSRSNSDFRSRVGMDAIKASYTSVRLSKNYPILHAFDSAQPRKPLPSQSRLISRIFDESLARYVRGLRVSEVSLNELSEFLSQLMSLQDAESQASGLKRTIASLSSDLAIAESEKNELSQEVMRIKEHHGNEVDALKSKLLSNERGNSVESAEVRQKIRSTLIESRRRLESEVLKLELLLQSSSGDTASSKQRLLDRIRKAIADLETKVLEIFS
jgi:hypothetical protein